MLANATIHDLSVRAFHAACGLAGIFLLLLQTFGPALASPGESMWIEICSEAGAVWVEVDLDEEGQDPTKPCPKCADCTLCAVTGVVPVPDVPDLARIEFIHHVQSRHEDVFVSYNSARLWPETRGPPREPEIKTERASRASKAFTQVSGGAPWS
ncbi:DUF2946 family protein [Ruegeria sp. EL01]|uniref:DUF2946 family protein n=1 Tax=Ruegeria sp. EL01 TaxID=2107578 RepID=UPI0020B12179|nr:DUF2946 family protein [Ruegeria sp. EL01]